MGYIERLKYVHKLLDVLVPMACWNCVTSRSTVLLVYRSGNGLFPCHSGLSVSHDSVFTAEHRTPHSSSEDLDTAQSSSSLSIQQLVLPGVRVSSKESFQMYHPVTYCHCLVCRYLLHCAFAVRFSDWGCHLLNAWIHDCVHRRHSWSLSWARSIQFLFIANIFCVSLTLLALCDWVSTNFILIYRQF